MNFKEWFNSVPHWDAIGWLVVIAIGAYWEVMGAIHHDRTTFTDLVRTLPLYWRLAVLVVLFWHFCMGPGNYNGPHWWFKK